MQWLRWAVDLVAIAGLAATTIGMGELGRVWGLGAALAWLWAGAWLMGMAFLVAAVLGKPSK